MSETSWFSAPTAKKCVTCGSFGFMTSPVGKDRCSFCDGTEGGTAPTLGDCADRIEELEAKLAELLVVVKRAVRLSLDHSDFKLYAMEPLQRAIAAAELKGQDDE